MKDLLRFHEAQKNSYEIALREISSGKKKSHWIWYIFPQLTGLGNSSTAQYYAISDLQEARAYLQDEILRNRLIEISQALLMIESDNPLEIMGYPDNLKLQSSMTLFAIADPQEKVFLDVLAKFYQGEKDQYTLHQLKADEG